MADQTTTTSTGVVPDVAPAAAPSAPAPATGTSSGVTMQKPNFGLSQAALANVQWAKHYPCNCWEFQLAQGVAVLPCASHQAPVLKTIQSSVELTV